MKLFQVIRDLFEEFMEPEPAPSPALFLFGLPKYDMVRSLTLCASLRHHYNYTMGIIERGCGQEANRAWGQS